MQQKIMVSKQMDVRPQEMVLTSATRAFGARLVAPSSLQTADQPPDPCDGSYGLTGQEH